MQNLRDKLMKAGLVTQEQAKQAEAETPKREERPRREDRPRDDRPRREDRPPRREDRPFRRDDRPRAAQPNRPPREKETFIRARPAAAPPSPVIPKLPPLPGSKAHQRIESKKQMELDRRLRELVTQNQVAVEPGEHTFYFVTRKNRLRRMELTPAQAQLLEVGELAVVERPEPAQIEHSLVPAAIAEQMHAISAKSVRFLNRKDAPVGFLSDDELKSRQAREAEQAAKGVSEEAASDAPVQVGEAAEASDAAASDAAVQVGEAAGDTAEASDAAAGDGSAQASDAAADGAEGPDAEASAGEASPEGAGAGEGSTVESAPAMDAEPRES